MNKLKLLFSIFLMCFIVLSSMPILAMANTEQTTKEKIDTMVQEHMDKAKIPSVSIAFVENGDVIFLSYGEQSTDKEPLYQIGSTTKAFTALGVLWLEDEGLLSLADPISLHIPWFTAKFEGNSIPSEELTIANLLYQSSGFTNDESKFPPAHSKMTLEESVRAFSNCELAFYPSSHYTYANANYNILGYIIEVVSGQSYESFMSEKILVPLGLNNTYTNPQIADNTDRVVGGSHLAFFQSHPYEIPVNVASVPAGYIISDINDMSRWLQIQMGHIDTTKQFTSLVEKSHLVNTITAVDAQTNYASDWFVKNDGTIYHSGGTPNYSSRIMFNPNSGLGVCVLTNINASANTELIAENVIAILEGKEAMPYQADIWTTFDTLFSVLTFVCTLALIFILFFLIQIFLQKKNRLRTKTKWTRKATLSLIFPIVMIVVSAAIVFVLPIIFGSSWVGIGIWAPYSIYTGTIAFTLCSAGVLVMVIQKSIWRKV